MIIACDHCNTRFRLDDSRVKPEGVKVRCTKCQNVFVVTPPQPVEVIQPEELVPQDDTSFQGGEAQKRGAGGREEQGPAATDGGQSEAPDLSFGGPDFSTFAHSPQDDSTEQTEGTDDRGAAFGSFAFETPFGGPEGDDGAGPDDETPFDDMRPQAGGISFHERLFLNEDAPEEGPSIREGGEGFEPGEGEGTEGPSMDFSVASSTVSEGHGEETGKETSYGEFDFSFDDADRESSGESDEGDSAGSRGAGIEDFAQEDEKEGFSLTPPPAPGRESSDENVIPFSATYNRNGQAAGKVGAPKEKAGGEKADFADLFSRTLSETAGEPSADAGLDDETFDEEPPPPPPPPMPGGTARPASSAGGKGLLLAVLIFIISGGIIYFSGLIDTIARTLAGSSQSAVETVEIENIGGYFAENKNFGKFFVIEAKIRNTSGDAQAIKAITGLIYDKRGKAIATRSVSPGRLVSADDLKNLSKDDLLKQFRDASGGTIPPKGTVPVMVLFTELPAGMSEYGLNIVRE